MILVRLKELESRKIEVVLDRLERKERGVAGVQGGKGNVGSRGPKAEPVGPVGPEGEQGVQGTSGERGPIGTKGDQGVRGSVGPIGPKGVQGFQVAKGDRGERGERGVKGEKGIQCDNSNVLSVFAEHLPIQLATRYGEKMRLIKYYVSEDLSRIVELAGGMGTLRCVSAYHESAWHFDAKFIDDEGHEMENVKKANGHGHCLQMKNSAHYCPYDLASNKVNAIYIVYQDKKIR